MTPPPVVRFQGISKRFRLRRNAADSLKARVVALATGRHRETSEDLWALRDVTLTIGAGEAVAFVGRNGSGKSTLLKLVAGITPPTLGAVLVRRGARVGTMIELGVGFHGELSARDNVYLNAAVHGLDRRAIDAIYPSVVEYSGLAHFMDQPVKNFSSGMHMRLGFAVAVHLDPAILLLDEVFAVGDAEFQRRCLATMAAFRAGGGTLLFVSHSPDAVSQLCDRAVVLDAGRVQFDGDVDAALTLYGSLAEAHGEALPGAAERAARVASAPWHQQAIGGDWEALGDWAHTFLRDRGLTPATFFLDMGCASLPVARRLLPEMLQSRYWGYDPSRDLFNAGVMQELAPRGIDPARGHFLINDRFDLSGCPYGIELALVHTLLPRLLAEDLPACLGALTGALAPGARAYLVVGAPGENETLSPMGRAVSSLATDLGLAVSRVAEAGHPRGDDVLELRKPA